jgi:hypothetical protein
VVAAVLANPHLHFEVFSTHKLSIPGYLGDTNSIVFEQNPTRFCFKDKKTVLSVQSHGAVLSVPLTRKRSQGRITRIGGAVRGILCFLEGEYRATGSNTGATVFEPIPVAFGFVERC